jgi:hypothetical protein
MTSHGWLLLMLVAPVALSVALFFTETRELGIWMPLTIGILAVVRLVALRLVGRRLWNGVLLGAAASAAGIVLHLADNLGFLPNSPPNDAGVTGLNWAIVFSGAAYLVAAYVARTRRESPEEA